ncbi:13321_t:CDS:2, partial [Funneliformis geosporum]
KWHFKLRLLYNIICGLDTIHKQKLIHRDFHDGNILRNNFNLFSIHISDLGLCKPVNYYQTPKNTGIFGVLPFVAPEVLRGQRYTPASDIYSFSMIMWEFISGIPPFNDRAHDSKLKSEILSGKRPEIIVNISQCYVDLMKICWDMDPLKRPATSEN